MRLRPQAYFGVQPLLAAAFSAGSHKPKRTSFRQILWSAALKIFALQPAKISSEIRTFGLWEQTLTRR